MSSPGSHHFAHGDPTLPMIRRIVSGGQTGADRAALDAARALGIDTGGWVPRGRWAEDGPVPDAYPNMKETDSADPAFRTEYNVRDSHGTVVFSHGEVFGGTKWTVDVSETLRKPLLRLDLAAHSVEAAAKRLLEWTSAEDVEVLNVAGPRESEDGDIHAAVRAVLDTALRGTLRSLPGRGDAPRHRRENRDGTFEKMAAGDGALLPPDDRASDSRPASPGVPRPEAPEPVPATSHDSEEPPA